MPGRNILILEAPEGLWHPFLKDYFSDIPAAVHSLHEPRQASGAFDQFLPGMIFLDPAFLAKNFLQKLRVRKNTNPDFRAYLLGKNAAGSQGFPWDAVFPAVPSLADFNKRFVETLPLPEVIRMLVVDDEEEIAAMVRDYFEERTVPAFEIEHAANGAKGLEAIARGRPDVIVLDIKMPVMDGREFYAELIHRKIEIPVVIFFDSISGEELATIRKHGDPPVVEKGTLAASLPALMALAKKMIYFRTK